LWRELGRENFVKYYFEQKAEIEATEGWKIDIKESDLQNKINTEFTLAVEDTNVEGFDQWKRRYVLAQKQENLNSIKVPFLYGLVSNEYLMELADLLMHFGEDTIRFTMQQNIHLRNIPTQYLGNLFKLISKITDLSYKPALIGNVITCTGADTCKLGICLPKGLLGRINDSLNIEQSGLDRLNNFKVNVSGCPNTCGQHMTADLGFFGKIKRNGDHIYPAYNIVAGASEHLDDTSMAIPVDIISSKDLPNFLNLFLAQYLEKMDNYSSFKEYILDGGKEDIIALCDQFRAVPNFDEDKNYYFDWGAKTIFSLEGKGQGECSAGVFDLIKFDLNSAKKLIKNNEYTSDAVLFTARALLVTKGVEARGENEAYEAFEKFFIKRGLVGEEYRDLIKAARAREELVPEDVISFKKTIDVLYNSMSNSLIFAKEKTTKVEKKAKTPLKAVVNKEEAVLKDLRGVKCPINFVKTKIELAKMASGEVLEIYLDHGEPIENVPGSVRMEGHEVISEKNVGDYWSVTIRKA